MYEQHLLDLNAFKSSLCVLSALASSELFLVFFQDRTFLEFAVCGICVWGALVLTAKRLFLMLGLSLMGCLEVTSQCC